MAKISKQLTRAYSDARRMFRDVEVFHKAMGFHPFREIPIPESEPKVTRWNAISAKRQRMIKEECRELCEALEGGNKAQILHESIDLVYVTLGALVDSGVTWAELSIGWAMVQQANMSKDAPDDPMSKAIKGEGFVKANVSQALGSEGEEHRYAIVSATPPIIPGKARRKAEAMIISTIGPANAEDFTSMCIELDGKVGELPVLIMEIE